MGKAAKRHRAPKGETVNQPFPKEYKRLRSPNGRLQWLAGPACNAHVKSGRLKQSQVRDEAKNVVSGIRDVAPLVPSPALLDDHQQGFSFPPIADDPACCVRRARWMLNRGEERVLWPAIFLDGGATFDAVCLETEQRAKSLDLEPDETLSARLWKGGKVPDGQNMPDGSTASPTAIALAQLDRRRARLRECELEPADQKSLENEIARHLRRQTKKIVPSNN